MNFIYFFETNIKECESIGISSFNEDYITEIFFNGKIESIKNGKNYIVEKNNLIKKTWSQISEYFNGTRKLFDIPLLKNGTDFQNSVWSALEKIPYGETCTYKDIATAIGNPKASRAVGMANNKNKIPIIIPCHRVIGANKKLIGYAGGLNIKEFLLNLEKKYK